jgi:hypothetical protein
MPNEDQRNSLIARYTSRRLLVLGALFALALVGVVLFLLARNDEPVATSPIAAPSPATAADGIPKPDSKSEVIDRLREILQIRERAIKERDASLFDEVYTSNCPCLRAGRAAIAALNRENILWTNRSISIEVQSTKRISERLWEVVALFVSDPFRIETEEGRLVREAPAERIRYRFLLVRTSDEEPWRLGGASPLEG